MIIVDDPYAMLVFPTITDDKQFNAIKVDWYEYIIVDIQQCLLRLGFQAFKYKCTSHDFYLVYMYMYLSHDLFLVYIHVHVFITCSSILLQQHDVLPWALKKLDLA